MLSANLLTRQRRAAGADSPHLIENPCSSLLLKSIKSIGFTRFRKTRFLGPVTGRGSRADKANEINGRYTPSKSSKAIKSMASQAAKKLNSAGFVTGRGSPADKVNRMNRALAPKGSSPGIVRLSSFFPQPLQAPAESPFTLQWICP
jgi:hypothetical protein